MAAIPPPSDALWDRLLSGQINHKFALFAANMAVARAVRIAAAQPDQKPALVEELHRFCVKYADQVAGDFQTLR